MTKLEKEVNQIVSNLFTAATAKKIELTNQMWTAIQADNDQLFEELKEQRGKVIKNVLSREKELRKEIYETPNHAEFYGDAKQFINNIVTA